MREKERERERLTLFYYLNYRCSNPPVSGMWKGVTDSGRVGYFDPCKVAPYVDIKASPLHRKARISRKGITHFIYFTVFFVCVGGNVFINEKDNISSVTIGHEPEETNF